MEILEDKELDLLDNLELLEYKRQLWAYGYELEAYLYKLKTQWILTTKILQERVTDIQYDLAILQADKEDSVGDVDSPDFYVH